MFTLMLALLAVAPAPADTTALLLVANKQENTLSVIEIGTGRLLATLPTGHGPHEVAVSSDGRRAVVANYGDQTPGSSLTVMDLGTRTVQRTIDLGEYRRPHGIVILPGDSLAAVTVEASQAVLIVRLDGGVKHAIPLMRQGGGGSVRLLEGGQELADHSDRKARARGVVNKDVLEAAPPQRQEAGGSGATSNDAKAPKAAEPKKEEAPAEETAAVEADAAGAATCRASVGSGVTFVRCDCSPAVRIPVSPALRLQGDSSRFCE